MNFIGNRIKAYADSQWIENQKTILRNYTEELNKKEQETEMSRCQTGNHDSSIPCCVTPSLPPLPDPFEKTGFKFTGIKEFQTDIHRLAVEKGWWEAGVDRNIPECLALIHSEVSEALEEYRNPKVALNTVYFKEDPGTQYGIEAAQNLTRAQNGWKPEGFGIELADTIIRILDLCERLEIDLETAVNIKHAYNKTRSFRHGGKKA